MMNFSRNSNLNTTTHGLGTPVLVDGNMITPLITLPQKQPISAATISNSVVDFQRTLQSIVPTTPTPNTPTADELFRWWISQTQNTLQNANSLVVVTSTNTPAPNAQTPAVSVASISPVANTNVVSMGMSPRANGLSPRANLPAITSQILHSPVPITQGISPRSISAMSPRTSVTSLNSPNVNIHSPLGAMNLLALNSGTNSLKPTQPSQLQQQHTNPPQTPTKPQPNLSIGGLTPFVTAFNKFYDIFNCDLIDPARTIVRKDEFPRSCLKEIFSNSKISEALMKRGFQLTPEEYQTLDYVLKINCFDECFKIFLRIYFKTIDEVLITVDGEQKFIQYYKNIWKSYLMGAVLLETMYGTNPETGNMALMDNKSLQGANIGGKVLLSLTRWKEFFFDEKAPGCMPLAVRKLIEKEFAGDGHFTEMVTPEILNSYKILGIYPTKSTRLSDNPSPLEWFEFVRWHLIKFPVLPETSNLIAKKPENINIMVQPPPQMLRPQELSRPSEFLRPTENLLNDSPDQDEYVEVVATPRPSPKPYQARRLERMRPPFMAPINFISPATRTNSQPVFVQPQLPGPQQPTNNNTSIHQPSSTTQLPPNSTINLPMISTYLMQQNVSGIPMGPMGFRVPTLPHRSQSQFLMNSNSSIQNGSILEQSGINSGGDDTIIINDKKAIRRIKNNEASRRYRARMREKRKEWAEKLRERSSSNSKSPEAAAITVTKDNTCQTSEMQLQRQMSLNEFSLNLFARESRESSLESFEPDMMNTADRFVKKQLYKISRREKNNIAVRKYRHKRKQRIEQNKKELVWLSQRHLDLLKEIEMLKKQMSVLLAFEGITDNELLRSEVNKLENASAIAENRFTDPPNLLERSYLSMNYDNDTIVIEESE